MQLRGPHTPKGREPLVSCVAMSENVPYVGRKKNTPVVGRVHNCVISSHFYITTHRLLLFLLLPAFLLHSSLVGSQNEYRCH